MTTDQPDPDGRAGPPLPGGPTAGGGADRPRRLRRVLPAVSVGVVLVLVWWIAAALLRSSVFPDPASAVERLVVNLSSSRFVGNLGQTVVRLLVSYALVVALGAVVGFALGLSRFWTEVLSPIVHAVYSVPKIVLFPLFLLFFGLGELSRIAFAFFASVVPMVLIVMGATAGVPRPLLKLAASLQLRTSQVVLKVVLPCVLPAFTGALRLTFGLTFLGLLIAEMFSGVSGLGYELLRNVPLGRMGDIVGEVLLIIVLALGPATALHVLEGRVVRRYRGAVLDGGTGAAPADRSAQRR